MRHWIACERGDGVRNMRRKSLARRDLDLFLHQIAAINFLGDGVLHLDARVHLHEVIIARRRRPGTPSCRHFDSRPIAPASPRRVPFFCASAGVMSGEGHSSITFWLRRWMEQSRSPRWTTCAVAVGHDLKFDVMRIVDQFLDVNVAVPERFLRFRRAA